MVTGLLSHTNIMVIGKLQLIQMAIKAARTICKGIGKKQQKIPTRNALETERLLMCHKLGSCSILPRKPSDFILLIFSGLGKYFLINLFGIIAAFKLMAFEKGPMTFDNVYIVVNKNPLVFE